MQQAKQEGYRSRAVYKLLEIDEKHKILDKARRIIDLGAAPGGWSQISAQVTDSTDEDPKVVAIDFSRNGRAWQASSSSRWIFSMTQHRRR